AKSLSIASTELHCWRRGQGEFKKERGQPCPLGDRSKSWETHGQGSPRSSGEILERTLAEGWITPAAGTSGSRHPRSTPRQGARRGGKFRVCPPEHWKG